VSNFGEITGYPEGSAFTSREEARQAGLHRHKIAGISGTGTDGADAIVLNDCYEDDEDYGDTIIYTGEGAKIHVQNGKLRINNMRKVMQVCEKVVLADTLSEYYGGQS